MATDHIRSGIIIAVIFSVFLASCAVRVPSFLSGVDKQAEKLLAGGEFKKALEVYSEQADKYGDKKSLDRYLNAGERIRHHADDAYQAKNFARAGSIYNILLGSRICQRDADKALSFDDDYLRKQLTACSKSLTEAGIRKYREEKLVEAIAIWEGVMAFDPNNAAVAKAIDTASRQLQGLKNMK